MPENPLTPRRHLKEAFCDDLDTLDSALDSSVSIIHGFMRNFLAMRQQGPYDALEKLRTIFRAARDLVNDDDALPPAPRIPRTMHRIWLTNPSCPHEPPTIYVDNLLREAEEYATSGWVHRLWVLDPEQISTTVERVARAGGAVKVIPIEMGLPGGGWQLPFDKLLADRKFPFAADILRMRILYEYGGIYADMGARFRRRDAAEFVTDHFDYALIFWETMFFQNSVMAMPAASLVGAAFLRIVENPHTVPANLIGPLDGLTEGMLWSGLMVTAILLSLWDKSIRFCPLAPNAELVAWASEKSWYSDNGGGTGKFGNAYVPGTRASFLEEGKLGTSLIDPVFALSRSTC